ncbi:MAG: peptide chain release factor 2, partial [Candidatus Kerfeldbacteria bacterium]|nr:peptide chain release factor 2 [Candidatus Kerfeldbacteria bacterium]
MQELINQVTTMLGRIGTIGEQLNIAGMRAKVLALEVEMAQPEFWQNQTHAQTVSRTVNDLRKEVGTWEALQTQLNGLKEMAELNVQERDADLAVELRNQFAAVQKQFTELEFHLLFGKKHDEASAVLAIHAGAGGVDAQDWAEILMRMMLRYCELKGFQVNVLDLSRGNEAGIKSATMEVVGRYAYGYLKSEHGVHRLVRQSPFNADALRQTSFALIEVLPELGELSPVKIDDEDLRIDVYRAGGKGGQGVNTTDSAVRITHLPTNIVVTCQNERSQHQNKATAMKILLAKLNQLQLQAEQAEKNKLRGEYTSAEWGNQIRSYVLHPYKMVKDHRTGVETSKVDTIFERGELDEFIEA